MSAQTPGHPSPDGPSPDGPSPDGPSPDGTGDGDVESTAERVYSFPAEDSVRDSSTPPDGSAASVPTGPMTAVPPGSPAPGSPPPGSPAPGSPPGSQWQQGPAHAAPEPATRWEMPAGAVGYTPVHRPGAIPLRPLGLGDIYDGAVRVIRRNLGATVGAAVLIAAVTSLVPLLVSVFVATVYGALPPTSEMFNPDNPTTTISDEQMVGAGINVAGQLLGAVVQSIGLLLVTGMIIQVVSAATLGKVMTLAQAWEATRGHRWRLIGLSLLLSAIVLGLMAVVGALAGVLGWALYDTSAPLGIIAGILLVLASIPLFVFLYVRMYLLSVPALMLEQAGIVGSIRRAWRLTRGAFWRTFGIALLTAILVFFAAGILSIPFSMGSSVLSLMVGNKVGMIGAAVATALGSIAAAALTTPFSAAVTSLQYIDLRMRKEGLDVQLIAATQGAPDQRG